MTLNGKTELSECEHLPQVTITISISYHYHQYQLPQVTLPKNVHLVGVDQAGPDALDDEVQDEHRGRRAE